MFFALDIPVRRIASFGFIVASITIVLGACSGAKTSLPAQHSAPALSPNSNPVPVRDASSSSSSTEASTSTDFAARLTHGVAMAPLSPNAIVLWARADRPSTMHVQVAPADVSATQIKPVHLQAQVDASTDFTGLITVRDLQPRTDYRYRMAFAPTAPGQASSSMSGAFSTPPLPDQEHPVLLGWSGDLAGQNACRHRQEGFPIFEGLDREGLDLFVGAGDMIYADNPCKPIGAWSQPQIPRDGAFSTTLADYRKAWAYTRGDPGFQKLLAQTFYLPIWDDHEVVNDFGPQHDRPTHHAPDAAHLHLAPLGLRALLEWNPILPPSDANRDTKLYRQLRWGKHLDLFILDTRQYRDANAQLDSKAAPKTMLGHQQREWFLERILRSDATWKVVVSSVPMALPTGSAERGRDSWSDLGTNQGFEFELHAILEKLAQSEMPGVVFLTADVHFAAGYLHRPFPKKHPSFVVHEFVAGPLSAGFFPNEKFDTSLGTERLFMYGPSKPVQTWEEAKKWMNYGVVDIDASGGLIVRYQNALQQTVYQYAVQL